MDLLGQQIYDNRYYMHLTDGERVIFGRACHQGNLRYILSMWHILDTLQLDAFIRIFVYIS